MFWAQEKVREGTEVGSHIPHDSCGSINMTATSQPDCREKGLDTGNSRGDPGTQKVTEHEVLH